MTRVLSVTPRTGGNVVSTPEILRQLAFSGSEAAVIGYGHRRAPVQDAGRGFRACD